MADGALPTDARGPHQTRSKKEQEDEFQRRYRLQRECQKERKRKQLKEQLWIAAISFSIIGVYMAVEYGVHTFEIIEKEVWENPHPVVEYAGYGVFAILAIWPVWHSIKNSLEEAQNKKRR